MEHSRGSRGSYRSGGKKCGSEPQSPRAGGHDDGSLHKLPQAILRMPIPICNIYSDLFIFLNMLAPYGSNIWWRRVRSYYLLKTDASAPSENLGNIKLGQKYEFRNFKYIIQIIHLPGVRPLFFVKMTPFFENIDVSGKPCQYAFRAGPAFSKTKMIDACQQKVVFGNFIHPALCRVPIIPEYDFSTSRIIPTLYLNYTWATFVDSGPHISLGASRTKYSVSPAFPHSVFQKCETVVQK